MENLKRKTTLAALLLIALSTATLFAKGHEQRLEGTAKEIGQDYVTLEMAHHKLQKIKITSATKFYHGKQPASFSGMKTGDHVVFMAVPDSTTTSSTSTASSTATTSATSDVTTASTSTKPVANTQKDSLSLGLGFTAVQASY